MGARGRNKKWTEKGRFAGKERIEKWQRRWSGEKEAALVEEIWAIGKVRYDKFVSIGQLLLFYYVYFHRVIRKELGFPDFPITFIYFHLLDSNSHGVLF